MSTLISGLPQIERIPVYVELKAQLKLYAPEKPDDQTKQNKFYKLLAHIYVFYNDINCEYIKVVQNIPKKKIVAVVTTVAEGAEVEDVVTTVEGAVEDTTVEGAVDDTTVEEGTVLTPVVEKEDDEDCSCFIGDDTDDAATVDEAATAATADATAANNAQLVRDSMTPKMTSATPEQETQEQETPEQEAARNNTFNKVIDLLMNNNMDNNSSGIMEPITNVYDYITKEKYIKNYIKEKKEKEKGEKGEEEEEEEEEKKEKKEKEEKDRRQIHLLPRRFKVKETLEKTVRFKKDHSLGIQFLYRNSYIFIYLYLKYILQDNAVQDEPFADYIKGGSNEQSIEEQMIRLIS